MPVFHDYIGHVGTATERPKTINLPSCLNLIIRGSAGFQNDLTRALSDKPELEGLLAEVADIETRAKAILNCPQPPPAPIAPMPKPVAPRPTGIVSAKTKT